MIRIENVNKTYQTPYGSIKALDTINLTIEKGDIFGIIGFSGAGKSTLIRCLNRLEEPDSGSVHVGGRDITAFNTSQLRLARRKIGMIFQQFNLFDAKTVFENVAFPWRWQAIRNRACVNGWKIYWNWWGWRIRPMRIRCN